MKIYTDYPIKHFHTFRVDLKAPVLYVIENEEEIIQLFNENIFQQDYYVIGSGSNVLFLRVPYYIVLISTKGITIEKEDADYVWVKVKSGENWDSFVEFCVNNNWGGLENLSLIPGTVGASPVQNIGAYGSEVKDTIEKLWAINLNSGEKKCFFNKDCHFSYRNSFFKSEKKEKWLITEVIFRLTKRNHNFNLSYGNINKLIDSKNVSLSSIRQVIISQRKNKLPDYEKIGNAGSFFKNPIIQKSFFNELLKQYPEIPFFYVGEEYVKIPAAWLIEKAGLKGIKIGNVGTYINQPLVIVNFGNATSKEIYDFSEKILEEVYNKFNIMLEREVNVVI